LNFTLRNKKVQNIIELSYIFLGKKQRVWEVTQTWGWLLGWNIFFFLLSWTLMALSLSLFLFLFSLVIIIIIIIFESNNALSLSRLSIKKCVVFNFF
jgi:hypothetical protein